MLKSSTAFVKRCVPHSVELLLLFLLAVNCPAQDVYLLLPEKEQAVVISIANAERHDIATVGQPLLYGESPDEIGVMSVAGNYADGKVNLTVIEKATNRIATYPNITAQIEPGMLGPIRQLILAGEDIYYITASKGKPGFSLNRFSRKTGEVIPLPLPPGVKNPVLSQNGKSVLVYSANGEGLWRFDTAERTLSELAPEGLRQFLPTKGNASPMWNTYLQIPGNGVFRVSTSGIIEQMTDADLRLKPESTIKHVAVGIQAVFPVRIGTKTVIGGLRVDKEQNCEIRFIDPKSFEETGPLKLPVGVSSETVQSDDTGKVYYLNPKTKQLGVLSSEGILTTFGNVITHGGDDISESRILAVVNPKAH